MSIHCNANFSGFIGGVHIGPGSATEIPTIGCGPVGKSEQTIRDGARDGARDGLFLLCSLWGFGAHPSLDSVMLLPYIVNHQKLGFYFPFADGRHCCFVPNQCDGRSAFKQNFPVSSRIILLSLSGPTSPPTVRWSQDTGSAGVVAFGDLFLLCPPGPRPLVRGLYVLGPGPTCGGMMTLLVAMVGVGRSTPALEPQVKWPLSLLESLWLLKCLSVAFPL